MDVSLLEKRLAEEPIKIPDNPFWDVFKRFGRDEATSGAVNITSTGIADIVLSGASKAFKDPALSIAGPVFEKFGLFYWYFKEAADIYRTTPESKRKSKFHYLKNAFKSGMPTLIEDVLVHDPIYAGLMYTGLQFYPETPAWLLSFGSFAIAVLAVSVGEVGFKELAYKKLKRDFRKAGFGVESYYESRFLVSSEVNKHDVLEALQVEFNLPDVQEWGYHDIYLETNMPKYSSRIPKLRLRERENKNKEKMQTVQLVYTRAREVGKNRFEQYRYFPIKKDKIYFIINDQEMPQGIESIGDDNVRSILRNRLSGNRNEIFFERKFARNDSLLASVDAVRSERPFNVVELKVYEDINLLKAAMRYVMSNFPLVRETTYGKSDIIQSKL